jgi:hypothetical protein
MRLRALVANASPSRVSDKPFGVGTAEFIVIVFIILIIIIIVRKLVSFNR